MATAFTWTFPTVEKAPHADGLEDVIRVVHWRLRAERDGLAAERYGSVSLPPAVAATFKPFAEITKADVLGWVEANMGDDVAALKAGLEAELDALADPPVVAVAPPFA